MGESRGADSVVEGAELVSPAQDRTSSQVASRPRVDDRRKGMREALRASSKEDPLRQ